MLLAGNYLVASLIAFILLMLNEEKNFSFEIFLFGAGLGLFFVLSFFAYAKAINYAGTGLATTSSRLSVIIPIILSIIIYKELPSKLHLVGFVFTLITLILFYFAMKQNHREGEGIFKYLFLLAVFAGIGINDFAMKVFNSWRHPAETPFFVFVIFSSALFYSSFYIIIKKIKISMHTALWGVALGVPNVLSTIFLLSALTMLPAILVYPLMNVGIILLTTILAFIFWKEKLNRWGILALLSGILAIIFLSVS